MKMDTRKLLFTSAPLSGHLDWGGYLRTAAHLSRCGHDVLWVSEEPVRAAVEAAGVRFRAVDAIGWRWPAAQLPADLKPGERAAARLQRALLVMLSEDAIVRAVDNLLAVADEFKPDALIGEPTVGAAALAAEKLTVPYLDNVTFDESVGFLSHLAVAPQSCRMCGIN